ncbi:MAG: hypothetical protein US54_C0007G0039 [Candidatus Roizmanbacteria bacterium GW2011_GWA2_37_7]|uniref:PD-(D/E)XK endonuclease-like domain-containing protein n=1 Tax=Candidatus Roizmanbacteria bacterium GW2011_GWA2_37_7 TaxID=1618481 RepID=A0A0G0JP17_9BACT|nr:MAG: hypothetical protein US54_C0007G0039 [Candidatus Roizmanbacteria bacterium GW2011_GWA2_37_7]
MKSLQPTIRRITEKTFFHYLKCPLWVYHDAGGHQPEDINALRERLTDDGLLPEKERELIANREDIAEVTAEDTDEAFQQTLGFMREGRQTIYHGMLIHGHWVGSPDMLARVEGRSNFGNYYYIACDMKRARNLRDEYRFQGCFYGELLERIQGVKPIHGYVLTPDRSILSYNIEAFSNNYHLTLHELEHRK